MPNIPSMEPQILLDLLALSLEEAELAANVGERLIAVVSPWFSNVELALHPSGSHNALGSARNAASVRLSECLRRFRENEWEVRIGVLKYGISSSGLHKKLEDFEHERILLKSLLGAGARIYLCPNLHAKGVVTALGVITGSTNYTKKGLHYQMQNANYFAFDHSEYAGNRATLLAYLDPSFEALTIP